MRKDFFTVGNYVHVYNRGNHKQNIVEDDLDKWRFLACLRFFNDARVEPRVLHYIFVEQKTAKRLNLFDSGAFDWPKSWPAQDPLVKIVSYCLMPNHYHLLLQEIRPGGVSSFMHKCGTGFTGYYNSRHHENGSLFQGAYKAKCITSEAYLQYVDAYIQILNPLELLPDHNSISVEKSIKSIIAYPFSGFGESIGKRDFHITDRKETEKTFGLPKTESDHIEIMKRLGNGKAGKILPSEILFDHASKLK